MNKTNLSHISKQFGKYHRKNLYNLPNFLMLWCFDACDPMIFLVGLCNSKIINALFTPISIVLHKAFEIVTW